ncbi:type III secretion system chaperone [Pigmentiphaga aceris]|nr:type III secretion system chaperone [Pigmentiphaga aceris]
MDIDTSAVLREWTQKLEQAMGLTIGADDSGAFALHTQGGAPVVVEPVPGQQALILSSDLGTIDSNTPATLLRALLVANFQPGIVAPSVIGLQPQDGTITLRLIWTPNDAGWTYEFFVDVLGAFGEQTDALAQSVKSRDIERLLPTAPTEPGNTTFDAPQFA